MECFGAVNGRTVQSQNLGLNTEFLGSPGQCMLFFFFFIAKNLIACWLCENHVNVCLWMY